MEKTMVKNTILLLLFATLFACGKKDESKTQAVAQKQQADQQTAEEVEVLPNGEPAHITVQHILIAFKGAPRIRGVERSKEQAQQLAYEVMMEARLGADFTELMRKYSSDTGPGIYSLANDGVDKYNGEFSRRDMVPAFGDTGFSLEVGEIKVAAYDPMKSPFGWHIIKRLK